MKKKSLTKNSIFYLIYNVLNVLFPFLTGIYVARVLLQNDVGEVAYASNIAQYFVILAFLGIPTYGMREVAKCRDDKEQLNILFSELFIINAISTCIFSIIYFSMVLIVPSFRSNLSLFAIVGVSIVLNALNINWLYEGVEEFTYISIRNIVVKVILFTLLVILVRKPEDYLWYAFITVFGTAGNYFLNVINARKIVRLTTKGLNLKRHMKSVMYLVVVNLAIEIYTLVDTTMLGSMCDKTSVAIYSYGSRINKILLHIVNTFTMVVVPRLSAEYKKKEYDRFNQLISKTFTIILIISIPMIIGLQFTSGTIIRWIYGEQYLGSSTVLNILCLNLLISPVGYLLGSRVMLVSGNENKMVFCVGAGAAVNIIGNFIFISFWQQIGAAIASVVGEIVVMIVYLVFSHSKFHLYNVRNSILKITFAAVLMSSFLVLILLLIKNPYINISVSIAGAVLIYIGTLVVTKEKQTIIVAKRILRILHLLPNSK